MWMVITMCIGDWQRLFAAGSSSIKFAGCSNYAYRPESTRCTETLVVWLVNQLPFLRSYINTCGGGFQVEGPCKTFVKIFLCPYIHKISQNRLAAKKRNFCISPSSLGMLRNGSDLTVKEGKFRAFRLIKKKCPI